MPKRISSKPKTAERSSGQTLITEFGCKHDSGEVTSGSSVGGSRTNGDIKCVSADTVESTSALKQQKDSCKDPVHSAEESNTAKSEKQNPTPARKNRAKTAAKRISDAVKCTPKITDFYPVRRSYRKPESLLKLEKESDLHKKICAGAEDGLEVINIPNKGRGVITTRKVQRGDFVVEYLGDTISRRTALEREKVYAEDPSIGCYMYYFEYNNKQYCVDATVETKYLGRLVNHSTKQPNLITRAVGINDRPHLILVAARNIEAGEELLYDYGERNKSIISDHPWLVQS